jgi:hypothetical protein
MNEDRDMRDPDAGATTERSATPGEGGTGDLWARAAEQALRDMARAQRHATAHEQSTANPGVP